MFSLFCKWLCLSMLYTCITHHNKTDTRYFGHVYTLALFHFVLIGNSTMTTFFANTPLFCYCFALLHENLCTLLPEWLQLFISFFLKRFARAFFSVLRSCKGICDEWDKQAHVYTNSLRKLCTRCKRTQSAVSSLSRQLVMEVTLNPKNY